LKWQAICKKKWTNGAIEAGASDGWAEIHFGSRGCCEMMIISEKFAGITLGRGAE
jgi:hypothetical protein